MYHFAEIGFLCVDVEVLEGEGVDAFLVEDERELIDRIDVFGGDDGAIFDVAGGGDLGFSVAGEEAVGAAEEDVGLDSDGEQFFGGGTGWVWS